MEALARWGGGDTAGGDEDIPAADIYKVAVEEYRFQAQYNWSRTQYLLGFNAVILTAATVVAGRPGKGAAAIFIFGAVAAVLTMMVVRTQHDYYRAARNRVRRIEDAFAVPADQRLDTTSTLGERRGKVTVNNLTYMLLTGLVVAHTLGTVLVLR